MDVKILGSGCVNCRNLEANTLQALQEMGVEAVVDHVTAEAEIVSWGVMSTPALVVDDVVVVSGRVPTPDQISGLIAAVAG